MQRPKACLLPQAFLVSESKRIFWAVAKSHGGEKIKSQIRNVAIELGVDFDLARRARHGRIGGRAFPTLVAAFLEWEAAQKAIGLIELAEIHKRLLVLETGNKSDVISAPNMANGKDPRRRLGSA